MTISFTAPASGSALIRVTACCNENDSLDVQGYLALLDHTSHAQVGYSFNVSASNVAGIIVSRFTGVADHWSCWRSVLSV